MFMKQYLENNFKEIVSFLISILPTNFLRTLAYRIIFGYKIRHSYIGFGTRIAVSRASLDSCRIRSFNCFRGPIVLIMGKHVSVGRNNTFSCSKGRDFQSRDAGTLNRYLEIGEHTRIGTNHLFDMGGDFTIGSHTDISGHASQFYTHGAGAADRSIYIGDNCFIGSAVRFAPGVVIGNNNIVAMGSVVTRKFPGSRQLIGGMPAKVIRENYDWTAKAHRDVREAAPLLVMG